MDTLPGSEPSCRSSATYSIGGPNGAVLGVSYTSGMVLGTP